MSGSNATGGAIDYDLWEGTFASAGSPCLAIRKISFAGGNLSVTVVDSSRASPTEILPTLISDLSDRIPVGPIIPRGITSARRSNESYAMIAYDQRRVYRTRGHIPGVPRENEGIKLAGPD